MPKTKTPKWERPEVEKRFVPNPVPNLNAGEDVPADDHEDED